MRAAQTVPVSQMTEAARPLPKHENIDKGKVWIIFIGGAASLFLTTLAVENNSAWFPAISKANQAMAASKRMMAQQVRRTHGGRAGMGGVAGEPGGGGAGHIAGQRDAWSGAWPHTLHVARAISARQHPA